ncbi:MAG TPA: spore coat protein [Caproicibacter sp.]|nr:spore coat protein [Caproicibacter sp.]
MNVSQMSGNQSSSSITEKDLMNDVLASHKFITDTYNTYTNECSTPNIRDEFMRILGEEHQIQAEVFDTMKQRGWYQTPSAEQQKVQQAKQKYQSAQQQV